MCGVKQNIEGTVGELQQFDRWIGALAIQPGSDVNNDLPQYCLGRHAFGPAALGQTTQVRFDPRPDLQQVDEGLVRYERSQILEPGHDRLADQIGAYRAGP